MDKFRKQLDELESMKDHRLSDAESSLSSLEHIAQEVLDLANDIIFEAEQKEVEPWIEHTYKTRLDIVLALLSGVVFIHDGRRVRYSETDPNFPFIIGDCTVLASTWKSWPFWKVANPMFWKESKLD